MTLDVTVVINPEQIDTNTDQITSPHTFIYVAWSSPSTWHHQSTV